MKKKEAEVIGRTLPAFNFSLRVKLPFTLVYEKIINLTAYKLPKLTIY